MTRFLLAGRKRDTDRKESRFSLVNRLFFETKRNVLKSMISEILSLARLPISPRPRDKSWVDNGAARAIGMNNRDRRWLDPQRQPHS
jgi:hypothetical protein